MPATSVAALIRERLAISPEGRLPWCDVMELALYDPEAGYYRGALRRLGRGGDFFTSVSVGPVFGELAALFCAKVCRASGSSGTFAIIEQGANDGQLAHDILSALERDHPDIYERVQYWIVEPSALLKAAQAAALAGEFASRLRHADSLQALSEVPASAIFLANELLDAFSCHRICWEEGRWRELYVVQSGNQSFAFESGPLSTPDLASEVQTFPTPLPSGFTTDVNLKMLGWLRQLSEVPFSGVVWLLDYGLTEDEYFAESRGEGTLRRYHHHQMDHRVLEDLGNCDLTTHVPFTRLARAAESLGLPLLEYIEQGRFLSRLVAGRLTRTVSPPSAEWIRQFQTLSHPNHMGMSFHSMILGKGMGLANPIFSAGETVAARHRLGV